MFFMKKGTSLLSVWVGFNVLLYGGRFSSFISDW